MIAMETVRIVPLARVVALNFLAQPMDVRLLLIQSSRQLSVLMGLIGTTLAKSTAGHFPTIWNSIAKVIQAILESLIASPLIKAPALRKMLMEQETKSTWQPSIPTKETSTPDAILLVPF